MNKSNHGLALAVILAGGAVATIPAYAQSDRQAMQLLKRLYEPQGFKIESAKRRGTGIVATACYNGKKVRVTTTIKGEVTGTREIGPCTAPKRPVVRAEENTGFTEQNAKTYLENQGFEQIDLYRENGQLRAQACGDNRIHSFSVGKDGSVKSVRTNKKCRSSRQSETVRFEPSKIKKMLRREGFDRISVLQDKRAPYIARACRNNNRLELTIGRRGRIRDQRRVDGCAPPINPAGLEGFLRKKGYDRINVIKRDGPPYIAELCRDRTYLRLVLGRYGEIQREGHVGRCAGILSEAGLREMLSKRGLIPLAVEQLRRGWTADVCDGNKRVALRIGSRGRIRKEEVTGNCRSRTVRDVLENLEDRGARSVRAFVVGCFRGKRYRWEFDRLGKRTGRKDIGICR